MSKHPSLSLALCALLSICSPLALAQDKAKLMDEMAAYLEFVDYGGGTIFAEQIPRAQYAKMLIIDARNGLQYAKSHMEGAINIEWRQVLAQSARIPKDRMVLIYCNTGSLSAQAGFALRVAGWKNVRILQVGMTEWMAKGGLDAASKTADAGLGH